MAYNAAPVTSVEPCEVDKLLEQSTKRGIHMNIIQRAAAVTTVAAALVGAMGAVAPQAGAVTPPAKYNGVCGAGYSVVDSAPVGTAGTVYLTYSPSTGQDCVVTVRARPGTAVSMLAAVTDAQDVDPEFDDGSYTTYAGPVYIGHPGHCVSYWGRISGQSGGANNVHCAPLNG
ncbi:spore-associated protein [Streptomyces caeruleatus]